MGQGLPMAAHQRAGGIAAALFFPGRLERSLGGLFPLK